MVTLDFTLFATMASSSDTWSTRIWLEDTHVALRRPRSAQATNDRITFVSALDSRNKRGYDVLLFRPPASTGQKARAVTLYEDRWHELDHNTRTRKPYLGASRPDIHEFDGESLLSDHEATVEYSDKEPVLPRPKSSESSEDEIPTQTCTLVTYENISRPPTPPNKDTSTQPQYQGSPSPDQYRVSITTLHQEQQPAATNMATTTTTTTAATTTVRPGTPPADPTLAPPTSNSRSQQITCNLHNAMRRNPPTPGGSGGPSGPGGPGGPGRPGGPGVSQGPPAAVPAGGNADDRVMGNLPQVFDGDRRNARNFLDSILGYFRANSRVPGLNSPICKVSIALTLIQGPQVATWVRDMGAWIDSLNPQEDDIQFTWDTFVQEFTEHFTDSQEQQRARLKPGPMQNALPRN
jgi:hypothetical protein